MKRFIFILIVLGLLAGASFFIYRVFFIAAGEKGALQVTSEPSSTVYLNDQKIGVTPLCVCGSDIEDESKGIASLGRLFDVDVTDNLLPTGEYTIRLVPNDSKLPEFQEKITIGKSILTVVDRKFAEGSKGEGSVISLEKLSDPNAVELLVLTVPDTASVILDGERIGASPIHKTDLTDSNHELLVSKNGYADKAVRLKTAEGYKLVAKIYLGINDNPSSPEQDTASDSAKTDSADVQISQVKILQTGTGFLRVRQGPSLNEDEIGRVTPDELYPLVSEQEDWFQIEFEDGKVGWVNNQYAEKVEE